MSEERSAREIAYPVHVAVLECDGSEVACLLDQNSRVLMTAPKRFRSVLRMLAEKARDAAELEEKLRASELHLQKDCAAAAELYQRTAELEAQLAEARAKVRTMLHGHINERGDPLHELDCVNFNWAECQKELVEARTEIERLTEERDKHAAAAWAASLMLGGRERLEGKALELAQELERLRQKCRELEADHLVKDARIAQLSMNLRILNMG